MKIMGVSNDIVQLITVWLKDRVAYVEVGMDCSEYYNVDFGSGQGSILGLVLFNFYMSPLVKKKSILTYADDNYQLAVNKNKTEALKELQTRVIEAEQWMSGLGLKVNINKTELVIFHWYETGRSEIRVGKMVVSSKHLMNVLGIQFDSRLTWQDQVNKSILKSRGSLHALRTLQKYFNEYDTSKLITTII